MRWGLLLVAEGGDWRAYHGCNEPVPWAQKSPSLVKARTVAVGMRYRDRLSEPAIEGNGVEPTPGTGEPLKPGEFILGYPDENGVTADSPRPDILARNGSYMAYRRLEQHVGKFREFLRQHGDTREEQELIAAKLMGRWRSGAPLALAPEKDDAELGFARVRSTRANLARSRRPVGLFSA